MEPPSRFELETYGLRRQSPGTQGESLRAVAHVEGDATGDRDPACFPLPPDDSSRNVTATEGGPGGATAPPSTTGETADDDVEATLARALAQAAEAGRFDVVALLAAELQARRLARGGVVALDARRRGR
jgi:hypothetical protein